MINPQAIPMPGHLTTPRILRCLMADSMDNLFHTLAGWKLAELGLLKAELEAWYAGTQAMLADPKAKRGLDEVYSEIIAVVRFYLSQGKEPQ